MRFNSGTPNTDVAGTFSTNRGLLISKEGKWSTTIRIVKKGKKKQIFMFGYIVAAGLADTVATYGSTK